MLLSLISWAKAMNFTRFLAYSSNKNQKRIKGLFVLTDFYVQLYD